MKNKTAVRMDLKFSPKINKPNKKRSLCSLFLPSYFQIDLIDLTCNI